MIGLPNSHKGGVEDSSVARSVADYSLHTGRYGF